MNNQTDDDHGLVKYMVHTSLHTAHTQHIYARIYTRIDENSRQVNCEDDCLHLSIIQGFPEGNYHFTSKAVQI